MSKHTLTPARLAKILGASEERCIHAITTEDVVVCAPSGVTEAEAADESRWRELLSAVAEKPWVLRWHVSREMHGWLNLFGRAPIPVSPINNHITVRRLP